MNGVQIERESRYFMRQKVTSNEQILDTALEIAMRGGVDSVSVRKLAKALGIAVGSMYNYYPDKESLMAAVAETFWGNIMRDQEKLYQRGMSFTMFLEQYYSFLYSRLSRYDRSWLAQMNAGRPKGQEAVQLLQQALTNDREINPAIWNMELNQDAFTEYVFANVIALLQAGENNCRFFIYLLEHLLYDV